MSSRFELSDEPAFSNSYNWRSSAKLKLEELEQINGAQKSVAQRDMYDSNHTKSSIAFNNSAPLTRSVDLFSSSVGYDVNSNGIEGQNGRPKSPGNPPQSLSRAVTPSGNRKSNNEFTRTIDLGTYASLPSSSHNYQNSRPKTAVARKGGDDRVKSRPPIAPGRLRPQPSDTLPRSGTPATYSTAHSKMAAVERSSSLSNNKRSLHSSINSLDNLRHADLQQVYDKYSTVPTSSTNFRLERPGSRHSDVGPFSNVQLESSLGTPGERNFSANAVKSLLSESRPRSALAGSLALLEPSGTPVYGRSFAGTPDFTTRDKSSSLRHSTDMNLGASYDEIIKRLRKMETQTNRKKPESENVTLRSSPYVTNNDFKKRSADEYSTKRVSDEFGDTDDLKDFSVYDRNSARSKDKFQYMDGTRPRITGKATEISDKSKTYIDLSNRTGERMSAYSKNGAIESWLRGVTTESSDLFTEQLRDDKSASQESNFNSEDHLEYKESAKTRRSLKMYDTSNGYEDKARNERSRKLSNDSYQRTTSPVKQSVEKSSTVFTDSIHDVDKPTHATRKGFEPDLPLTKRERDRTDLSSYDPNMRSDSRLSLLRKYLDQADCIGTQAVSSAVDNGYLKLPDELGMEDLRRSSSALDHRNSTRSTSHLNSSSSRKLSSDLSYLGNSSKLVYATTTLARASSREAFNDKDLQNGISLSREKLDSYQKSSDGQRHEKPTFRSERNFQGSNGYSFNALTSSMERPRSPTRTFGETITDKIGYGMTAHNGELTRSESETENERKNKDYTKSFIYDDKTPSYSSIGQDWMSRSYGKSALGDAGKAEEKKKHDVSGSQLTGEYADPRTLLSILENNRKYKGASTADLNQKPEAKYSSRTTAELAKLSENANSGVGTTRDFFRRSPKYETRIENELGQVRSSSDFSSLGPPKRVWYSEEHLAPSTIDADNDISVRFDYKPDTFRYVLRKDAVDSAAGSVPLSSVVQERSAAAAGVRKWRSDLALFEDKLESKDRQSTAFDSRDSGLSVLRSSSFRGTKESKTPDRRQVTWKDEVLHEKESGGSSIAMNGGNATLQDNMFSSKESAVSPSAKFFTPSFERLQPTERPSIIEDSTGLVESRSLYESLTSQSPSSKSFLASKWYASGKDEDRETKLKQTVSGDPNSASLHETPSNYRPSSSFYESLRSQSPSSKKFLASTWSASGRDEDQETKLKQTMSGDSTSASLHETPSNYRPSSSVYENLRSQSPSSKSFLTSTWSTSDRDEDRETKLKQIFSGVSNLTSLHETPSNYRPSSSLYEGLKSQSPSSKSFLASSWSASGRDEDRETKLKQAMSGDSSSTSLHETPSNYRPSSSMYENLRSQSPSSKTFLASSWSASGRDEDRETKLKQTMSGDSNPTSLHETPSISRLSYWPISRPSSTSYTYSDQEPPTSKASNIALNDDYSVGTSTTNRSKPPTNDHPPYKHHAPSDDGVSTKTSAYLSTDSIHKSSYSPTSYKSTALHNPPDTQNDYLTGNYTIPNSVLKTDRERTYSGPYSSLGIAEFLASRSTGKSTNDSNKAAGVLQDKWRSVTSNGVSTSEVPDSYRHLLSSSTYAGSTHKDSSHLTSASLLDSSAKEMSSTRGFSSSSKPHQSDNEPLNLATKSPHDTSHLTPSLLSSTYTTAAKDHSTTGLPYKYLSYANHVSPSSNCSNANTSGQSSNHLSDPYSVIGHRVGLASSRSTSRHLQSDSLTNGISTGMDFLSGVTDKHDDGLSLLSETEFVVMRSGDIVKRPFKKSGRGDAQIQSRHSKPIGSARNLLR